MYAPPQSLEDVPSVKELVEVADRTVAGLETAKRRIALLLHRQMVAGVTGAQVRIPNLLVVGPSGGGKTHLLNTMLDASGCVWTEANITEYSDTGYVGRDMTEMYGGLVSPYWRGDGKEAHTFSTMVGMAERFGVVLIDEFDKIRMTGEQSPGKKKDGSSGERSVGRALQAELLKLVEGAEILSKRFTGDNRGFTFRTHRVLHIATGAFEGLPRLMNTIDNEFHNDQKEPTMTELENIHMEVNAYDIQRYGFMQELVGRFASIVPLPTLDVSAMERILREHVVPEYTRQMAAEGIKLEIEPGAMQWIAGEARKSNIGARAMAPIMEELVWHSWSEAYPGCTIAITAHTVERRGSELRKPVGVTA